MQRNQKANTMSSRRRFHETMRFGQPDRVPYFEEGIRDEVINTWREQGLKNRRELEKRFPSDRRERIELDLDPHSRFKKKWPSKKTDLEKFKRSLDPDDRRRLPKHWKRRVRSWRERKHLLLLHVHRGFFLTMGVRDWQRFQELMFLLVDRKDVVRETMAIQGEFSARLVEKVLKEVNIDAAVFSEPIGGNEGPLISPAMYEDIVLKSYRPLLDVLNRYHVDTIIFQTFANARIFIPLILKWGFNTLWACEVNIEAMDYRGIRDAFGKDLRLIGGIDLDALRKSKKDIRREIEEKVPSLIADGGYVPLADGRVREDVPFENYVYYRELLEKVTKRNKYQ
jgi:uroporphyrinogen decarboxylase